MTILRDFSVFWALMFRMIMLFDLFESRFSKKKTFFLICGTLLPLSIINTFLFVQIGQQAYMTILLLTLTLPSLIILWFLAQNKDGRFLFTLFLVDTIVIEILDITSILEFFIPGNYIFMFLSRLIIYSLLGWVVYKFIRPIYLEVQQTVIRGWSIFAVAALIFYVIISLSMNFPTMITERPEHLPVMFLLFILMPIVYLNFFNTLRHQRHVHEVEEQENILRIQVASMTERINELFSSAENFRIERHNFRHSMQAMAQLLEEKNYEALRTLLVECEEAIDATRIKRYCANPILDAMLSTYLQKAERKGITVTAKIIIPEVLPAPEVDLSTVFANAIENAIHACEKLEPEKRFIEIQTATTPCFMLRIRNPYRGQLEFGKKQAPITKEEGHGFGTRSIVAFCHKHNAYYDFIADGEIFSLHITFDRT